MIVEDLQLIGESTNQDGPGADDYFFCFATGPEMWYQASFYAEGRDVFLKSLGARLGGAIDSGLCQSTDFASRILWPVELVGQPMFQYEDMPHRGWAVPRTMGGFDYGKEHSNLFRSRKSRPWWLERNLHTEQ